MPKKTIFQRWSKEEKNIPVHQETISFEINGKHYDFPLIHNFNFHFLDIYKAHEEWAKQASSYTVLDFCRYVMLQPSGKKQIICFPEDEWNDFQLNQVNIDTES